MLVVVAVTGSALLVAPSGATAAAKSATAKPPAIKHVFVINLENKNYDETFGPDSPATYLSKDLPAKGALLEQYFAIGHVSLDNYIAEISGQGPSKQTQLDCFTYNDFVSTGTGDLGQALGDGCVYPTSVKTIADQIAAKQLTWKGYMEDMSSPCLHPELGGRDPYITAGSSNPSSAYATRHNPFVYFHSIVDSPSCQQDVVPLTDLEGDLGSAKSTPNLSFITPNLCNDGHDATCATGGPGGLAGINAWLQAWVPKILDSPAFKKDGLLVVTFDEAEAVGDSADATTCCNTPTYPNVTSASSTGEGPGGGRIGAVLVSRFIKPGTTERDAVQPLRDAVQPRGRVRRETPGLRRAAGPAVLRQGRLHQCVGESIGQSVRVGGRVGGRRVERAPMPAARGEQEGAGIVLPHPAGEVATGPRGERGGADGGAGTERQPQDVLQPGGEPQVGAERAVDVGAVARGDRGGNTAGADRAGPRARRSRAPARSPRRSSGRRRSLRRRRRARDRT